MTTRKTIALTIQIFVGKVTSLILNMLCRFVIAFLPKTLRLFISWLKLLSAVILEPKKIVYHCFHIFPFYLPWRDGTRCHDVSFLNVEFPSQLFHSPLFTLIKSLFSSFSLSTIRVISSAYLRLLILLLAILTLACESSSPAFRMMDSAYKLNKQGGNIQLWCTIFPILNQSVFPCLVLTVASWLEYRFHRR